MKNIKPSQLIKLALVDLGKVEAQPETYDVNMGYWHSPLFSNTCQVCLAGAVMAMTLHASPKAKHSPKDFECYHELGALNLFQGGYVEEGLMFLGHNKPEKCEACRRVRSYSADPIAFKEDMLGIVAHLELFNL